MAGTPASTGLATKDTKEHQENLGDIVRQLAGVDILLVRHKTAFPPMNERTREQLRVYFEGEITRLEALLGRDLSIWKNA